MVSLHTIRLGRISAESYDRSSRSILYYENSNSDRYSEHNYLPFRFIGNVFVEYCEVCQKEYVRDYAVDIYSTDCYNVTIIYFILKLNNCKYLEIGALLCEMSLLQVESLHWPSL